MRWVYHVPFSTVSLCMLYTLYNVIMVILPLLFQPLQAVSTRACYLFSRLVKVLRQNIRAFVREILHSIQGHLVHIATHPPAEGGQGTSKAGGPGGAKITTMGAFLPATDDRYAM